MKSIILNKISEEEAKLNDLDVDGHVWWNKFRKLVDSIKGEKGVKCTLESCENCGEDYYREKGETKHETSGMWMCNGCRVNW